MSSSRFPSASEAHHDAKRIQDEQESTRHSEALKRINEAINRGEFFCTLPCPVPPSLAFALTELGYEISKPFQSDYNETSVKVSW